jgi:hypothetical protein
VAGIGVAGMRVYVQIKRSLRRVVPDSLVNVVRSANVAIRLGLLFPWLTTFRNAGRKTRFGTEYGAMLHSNSFRRLGRSAE